MNGLTHFPFAAAFYGRTTLTRLISNSILIDFPYSSLKYNFDYAGFKGATGFECDGISKSRVQFYSSGIRKRPTRKRKSEPEPAVVEPEKDDDSFFVVRKGDIIGVYNNFADCQAQVGSSIRDPPVSIYKGYALKKDVEDYLASCGLKNAIYSIRAEDLKDDLFGMLIPCPPHLHTMKKICILECDGASKGNPGQAGAGAIIMEVWLKAVLQKGFHISMPLFKQISKLREGLGIATCNVAEYGALLLGLKHALRKGCTSILDKVDSKLVCLQKFDNCYGLCTTFELGFLSVHIVYGSSTLVYGSSTPAAVDYCYCKRKHLNFEADAQANLAVSLAVGEVVEEV